MGVARQVGPCDKVVDSCNTSLVELWHGHENVSPVTLSAARQLKG